MRMRWLVLTLAMLLLPLAARAQDTRGKILGTVQDAQGVVPRAAVKITKVDTRTTIELVTNDQGYFEAPLLQPGTYDVTVELAGFKSATRAGVQIAVAQQVSLSFTLEVGAVSESIVVTGAAPVIDTNSVSSGANFDTQMVNALPMFSNMP